ncbi:MAG: hypothetical protein HZA31_03390 [Opitutae bacterium]|nr:hypothetical protein [Opitutae bacterium]
MPISTDTKRTSAVVAAVRELYEKAFPGESTEVIERLFADAEAMFCGRYYDYQAIDLVYHDFEHTLQATLCYANIFVGRHLARATPELPRRYFELGLAAALLHDTGYLKLRSDRDGTCAKFTKVHVLRSCAFAASYLPTLGFTFREIEIVTGAIRCTGPSPKIAQLYFVSPMDKLVGCMLVTGDFLGQMAAADYPDELEALYREFEETDNYYHVPPAEREFRSAAELIAKTPGFWSAFVRPRLEHEFEGVYRFLASPYPDGPNPYLDAIERNIAIIRQRPAGRT